MRFWLKHLFESVLNPMQVTIASSHMAMRTFVGNWKMPVNIVEYFGNASGVLVSTTTCVNLGEHLENESFKVCFAGFDVDLTWSSALLDLGNLDFCKMIYF